MDPAFKRVLWVVAGAVALLWFAARGRSSSGGEVASNPETGWEGRALLSDLCRSHAPAAAIIPGGYQPCNYFKHLPTGVFGTLEQISQNLGVSPSGWSGSPSDVKEKPSWYLIFHAEDCATGRTCEESS